MQGDIYAVYSDLNDLLEEICEFLSGEVKNGTLSPKASGIASKLIERSKVQLLEISKVVSNDNEPGRYVDMQGNKEVTSEYVHPDLKPPPEELQLYSDVNEQDVEKKNEVIVCPYTSLPAQKIPTTEKTGNIERKERFLFIEHQKKLFAGIYDDWLLMYYTDKDNRPFEMLHLKNYEVREMEKKDTSFELIPKENSNKSHVFTASTRKDVYQWVVAINRRSQFVNYGFNKPLPKTPEVTTITDTSLTNASSAEEIYEMLTEALDEKSPTKPKEKPPVPKKPTKVSIKKQEIDWQSRKLPESPLDTYDIIEPPDDTYDCIGSQQNGNEFGYGDEEEIYDTITLVTKPEAEEEVEEMYDFVQHKPQPVPVIEVKATPTKKKKTFGFRSKK